MAREVINCCNVISHFLMTDINNTQNAAKLSFKPGVYNLTVTKRDVYFER